MKYVICINLSGCIKGLASDTPVAVVSKGAKMTR